MGHVRFQSVHGKGDADGSFQPEHLGEDLDVTFGVPFTRRIRLKLSETVVFAYILFKSRAHHDRVNAKVMKDPRLTDSMDVKSIPFDCKHMVYGGFNVIVDAQ